MPVAPAGNQILHTWNLRLRKSRIYWMPEKPPLRFRRLWESQGVRFSSIRNTYNPKATEIHVSAAFGL